MLAEAVLLIARVVVGGTLLVALVAKLRDLPSFRAAVRGYRVVPRRFERPVVLAVLGLEAGVTALLAARASAPLGLAAAAALLTGFAIATARVVARGDRVPCGCFGRSSAPVGRAHVWRNALLASTAAAGLVAGLVPGTDPLDGPARLVLVLFAVAVVAVLLLADQLLAVPEPRRPRPPVVVPSTGSTKEKELPW